MKKIMTVILVMFAAFTSLFSYEDPIFSVNNIPAGYNYTVKDFYVYNYSDTRFQAYARLYYSGNSYRQYISVTTSLFKGGTMVGSKEAFADFETYGSYGMLPNSETLLDFYIDKVDFDSVYFNVSYLSSDGSEPYFNKGALTLLSSLIAPYSGSKKKVSGILKNVSGVPLKFPCVFICVYRGANIILFKQNYANAPDYTLDPLQTANFETTMDLPESYDSLKIVPNYSPSLTGPVIISEISENSPKYNPHEFSLSQNYPNPFNASTTLRFSTDRPQRIKIEIYDLMGKSVMSVFNGIVSNGEHSIIIDAAALSSGSYFYVLTGESRRLTKKMTILK